MKRTMLPNKWTEPGLDATPWRRYAAPWALLSFAALVGACNDDTGTNPQNEETTFQVTVENVSVVYDFTSTGVFNTPAGTDDPGPVTPGQSFDFTFDAGPGSSVSFATMFGQSNDLFYSPDGGGIQLYDPDGMPRSGDITDQVYLWDAGTEMNQEPGAGADQAPRQGGPNTGASDPNPNVRLATDDFGNLPAVEEAIRVSLFHLGGTEFRIRIANIASADALQTSGGPAPVVLSPGVWTVGGGPNPLFTEGQVDRGLGLEHLAEDGAISQLHSELAAGTGLTSPLAPGVYAVHTSPSVLFMAGAVDRGEGLESLAEDGNPSVLAASIAGRSDVIESGVFNTPEGAAGAGPAFPGNSFVFTVQARPGDRLSFATMLGQSNDLFFGPADVGVGLFDSVGNPRTGDITGMVLLWDAGTEVNEFPGIGPNQAPRQPGANTGDPENGTVRPVNDGYHYPETNQIIRVTLTPTGG